MSSDTKTDPVGHEDLSEVKERVATMEAKMDSFQKTQERLIEGQGEILNQIESINTSSLDRQKFHEEYRPKIEKNTRHRVLAKGGVGLLTILASLLSVSWASGFGV